MRCAILKFRQSIYAARYPGSAPGEKAGRIWQQSAAGNAASAVIGDDALGVQSAAEGDADAPPACARAEGKGQLWHVLS